MSNCIVCNQDTVPYLINLNIAGLYPPRDEFDALVSVCPDCGVMRITGAGSEHMRLLEHGYPEPTQASVDSIDIDTVLDQLALPKMFLGEKKRWLDAVFADKTREAGYKKDFEGGYPFISPEYNRIIHFLKLDPVERDEHFGPVTMTAIRFNERGNISFKGGYHRFCLFRFLGATRIPVAITDESIANGEGSGIKIYTSKTGD